MLNDLRRVNLDGQNLDELMALDFFALGLRARFEARQAPVPEWLDARIRELSREITRRTADHLEKSLKDIEAQEAALMTQEQKRAKVAAEKARLLAQMSGT